MLETYITKVGANYLASGRGLGGCAGMGGDRRVGVGGES